MLPYLPMPIPTIPMLWPLFVTLPEIMRLSLATPSPAGVKVTATQHHFPRARAVPIAQVDVEPSRVNPLPVPIICDFNWMPLMVAAPRFRLGFAILRNLTRLVLPTFTLPKLICGGPISSGPTGVGVEVG